MTGQSFGRSPVGLLQLLERGCLFEGANHRRGNTERESQDQDEGKTQKHRVQTNPGVLSQTAPELERVLEWLQIEEESTQRNVSQHSQHHRTQSHTPRVEHRSPPAEIDHLVLVLELCLGHPTAHAAAASAFMRCCHCFYPRNNPSFGFRTDSKFLGSNLGKGRILQSEFSLRNSSHS